MSGPVVCSVAEMELSRWSRVEVPLWVDPSSTLRSCLKITNWSASRQWGFIIILCLFEIFVSFSLISGMPVT